MGKESSHAAHRRRLRARFLSEGLTHFEKHTILEMLLCYAIPRRDVNELAHRLIAECGSLSQVFDADYERLVRIPGIGENAAALLTMIPQLSRAYLMDKETSHPSFADIHKLGGYLVGYYVGKTVEEPIAVFLNNRAEMIDLVVLGEGVANMADLTFRKIAEAGLARQASAFVLAHNHPGGSCEPSKEDAALTKSCAELFGRLGMPLSEHFIISGSRYFGLLNWIRSGRESDPDRDSLIGVYAPSAFDKPGADPDRAAEPPFAASEPLSAYSEFSPAASGADAPEETAEAR